MTVPNLCVVILTFNEEFNLPQALRSVAGWAGQTLILDSGSTDATVEVARSFGCRVVARTFDNYSAQRNFALSSVDNEYEWVFFLDADEWITLELQKEIETVIAHRPAENGFLIKRRLIWMDVWIRRGYYPTWILRLFRNTFARCDERGVNEHILVEGAVGRLQNDFIHEDRKGIGDWIHKHNRYAEMEAQLLLDSADEKDRARFFASQAERKKWFRQQLWKRLPLVARPFFYFGYRYVLRGGFLDGVAGLTYHFMQALWYQMLIDLKYLELRNARR